VLLELIFGGNMTGELNTTEPTEEHTYLELEYAQINDNFRFLADVRFKLLAFLPTLGGIAVFVLSGVGLQAGQAPTPSTPELLVAVLLVSVLGFLATLGITLYDQRNSELYNALIYRAKYLEAQFGVPYAPGGLKQVEWGGQFSERPRRARHLIFLAGHDLALALIYGPLLGAWFFPMLYAALLLLDANSQKTALAAAGVAIIAAIGFTSRLVALDRQEMERYKLAAERDGLAKKVA
jgi:hypothetical protein